MGKSKGSDPAPKPGTPEWRAAIERHDAEVQESGNPNQSFEIAPVQEGGQVELTVRAFGAWLRTVWVADLVSEPESAMPRLGAVLAGVRAGGA